MPLGHELQSLQSLPRGGVCATRPMQRLPCTPCQSTQAELSVGHKTCRDWHREEHPAVGLSLEMSLWCSQPGSHLLSASAVSSCPTRALFQSESKDLILESWGEGSGAGGCWTAPSPSALAQPTVPGSRRSLQDRHPRELPCAIICPSACASTTPTPINQHRPGVWKHLLPITFYYL